jgi:O-antigen/teichoic acid export membrane protein
MTPPDQPQGMPAHKASHGGGLWRLLRHTSNYSAGTLLITLASMVSFPIFTRTFTVAEYGMLGLVNVTLGFLVGVGKLGLQQSVVRFYAEIEGGKRGGDRVGFFSTVLFGMLGVGVIASALSALVFAVMPARWWGHGGIQYLIAAVSPLVLVRVLDSAMLNLLRAEQKSGLYSFYAVIRKYLGLAFVVSVLFTVARNLWGFFLATLVSEAVATGLLIAYYARRDAFSLSRFSRPLFIAMLGFGLPLLASELSGLLLSMGGRYIINFELGPGPLGSYSAAYNFCDYLQGVLTGAFAQAVVPMYLRMWEAQGRARTEEFLQQALHYYLMLAFPIVAGMAVVAPDLLRLLASDRYAVSTSLFVYIVSGMLVAGGTPIFSAGIYINKLTRVVMYSVFTASAVNLVLTAILTRRIGIEGAALATLCSLTVYTVLTGFFGRGTVSLRVPWSDLLKFTLVSGAMYAVTSRIDPVNSLERIGLRIACGALLYGGLLLLVDARTRGLARKALERLRGA